MDSYTISEVSERTGLSADTLRYYERIELLVDIGRNSSGHRCYDTDDLSWLNLLMCLRTTGMPISDMLRFAELVRGGDCTKPERLALLRTHRQNVLATIASMQEKLTVVEGKITKYAKQVENA